MIEPLLADVAQERFKRRVSEEVVSKMSLVIHQLWTVRTLEPSGSDPSIWSWYEILVHSLRQATQFDVGRQFVRG